jgi:hypothetical protein
MGNKLYDRRDPNSLIDASITSIPTYLKSYLKGDPVTKFDPYRFMGYTDRDPQLNYYFRKRACCSNNRPVSFTLPTIVSGSKKIEDGKEVTLYKPDINGNEVKATTLRFKVFTDQEYAQGDVCKLDDMNYKKTSASEINPQCDSFYDAFCASVHEKRTASHPQKSESLERSYGLYNGNDVRDPIINPTMSFNEFEDCNCQNSIFIKEPEFKSLKDTNGNALLDKNETPQLADNNCKSNVNDQKSYVKSKQNDRPVCINIRSVDIVSLGPGALMTSNQTCNINTNDSKDPLCLNTSQTDIGKADATSDILLSQKCVVGSGGSSGGSGGSSGGSGGGSGSGSGSKPSPAPKTGISAYLTTTNLLIFGGIAIGIFILIIIIVVVKKRKKKMALNANAGPSSDYYD